MFRNIFLAIQARLMDGDPLGLKHFDWYNLQPRDENQAQPFHCPAVLIEFLPWQPSRLSGGVQYGPLQIQLHLVQDRYTDTRHDSGNQATALAQLDLIDQLYARLQGWSYAIGNDTIINPMQRVRVATDHRQDNRSVTRMVFEGVACDTGSEPVYQDESPLGADVNGEYC